jgi:hypothetical protein
MPDLLQIPDNFMLQKKPPARWLFKWQLENVLKGYSI